MILEHIPPQVRDLEEESNVRMFGNEHTKGISITGEITDKIFKGAQLVKEIKSHNIVVDSMLILTASLLKGESGFNGITYWAVGSGSPSWDSNPVNPLVTEDRLTDEIGRVALGENDIVFLDSEGEETQVPTNILQITHTFGTDDCNGVWREFGLFGGNATSSLNSGQMIDKKHHAVITKTSDMSVERSLRLTLQFI